MKRSARLFLRLTGVTLTIGLVQAVVETTLVAVLYRDLLFAPYRFFTIQIYDAFTKLYFLSAQYVALPPVLDTFLAQGFAAKLALLPELAAVNSLVAIPVAALLTPVAVAIGMRADGSGRRFASRAVPLVCLLLVAVHVVEWLTSVKIPLDPTLESVGANLARDAIADGVLIALAVAAVAAVVTVVFAPMPAMVIAVVLVGATLAASSPPSAIGDVAYVPTVSGSDTPVAPGFNVVLVSIDSLRADHLGVYGYERATSPAIDRLATEGVRFAHCSSTTSWTLPAHVSMLTGRSLLGHGVVADDHGLDPSVPTLASAFRSAGYATGAVVSAPYLSSRYGFASGFDDYDDRTVAFVSNEDSYKTITAPLVNATAEEWIAGHSGGPFFLFLHYWDVHYDYAPGAPYDTLFDPEYTGSTTGEDFYFNPAVNPRMPRRDLEHVVALYDGEIRLVDDQIGRLVEMLERHGLNERTILVVTADHGDEFFEHGHKGHHRSLYEEVLAVPLVVHVPGVGIAPSVVEAEASIVDIAPTVLALTGIPVPPRVEGIDWTGVIAGRAQPPERTAFGELYRKGSLNVQVAAISERTKVIHHFNVRRMETYDLDGDPGEHDLLSNTQSIGGELAGRLHQWLDLRWRDYGRRQAVGHERRLEMDAKTAETLRSLGYVE